MTRDPGLSPERTHLAWRRTVLTCAVLGVVVVRGAALRDAPIAIVLALVATALALWAAADLVRRLRWRASVTTSVLRDGTLPLVVAAMAVAMGLAVLLTG